MLWFVITIWLCFFLLRSHCLRTCVHGDEVSNTENNHRWLLDGKIKQLSSLCLLDYYIHQILEWPSWITEPCCLSASSRSHPFSKIALILPNFFTEVSTQTPSAKTCTIAPARVAAWSGLPGRILQSEGTLLSNQSVTCLPSQILIWHRDWLVIHESESEHASS